MRLTEEQINALKPFEKHFDAAVNHHWVRYPGSAALDMIHDILRLSTGQNMPLRKSCSWCVLELMTDMGKVYFADLEERDRAKVEVQETAAAEPVKVEVKRKRVGRKPKTQE